MNGYEKNKFKHKFNMFECLMIYFASNKFEIKKFKKLMMFEFEMIDLGVLSYYIGKITYQDDW